MLARPTVGRIRRQKTVLDPRRTDLLDSAAVDPVQVLQDERMVDVHNRSPVQVHVTRIARRCRKGEARRSRRKGSRVSNLRQILQPEQRDVTGPALGR